MSFATNVMRIVRLTLFLLVSLVAAAPTHAQIAVDISVDIAPPPLPIYEQPPIPATGYLWTPGYWGWDDDTGYYWVPGTWVVPPEPALLWTPGYWGWSDGVYYFHEGYWGPEIGFYGGVAYGFGYTGVGYEGGYWRGGTFFYNQSVNNISNVTITNVYSKTVVNNAANVSFNGPGGITAQPTAQQLAAANQRHIPATTAQVQNVQAAAKDPSLSLNNNHGHPSVAATAHPAQFSGPGIVAAHPGQPVAAVTPQGHTISSPNRAINPNIKTGPAITSPGEKARPSNAASPPAAAAKTPGDVPPAAPAAANGANADLNKHHAVGTGTPSKPATGPAVISPGNQPGPEHARTGTTGDNKPGNAVPMAHSPTPQTPPAHAGPSPSPPQPQSRTVATPPAPQPPPPPPHTGPPPPPPQAQSRTAAPPPPPPPGPQPQANKPKCKPGEQHC